MSDTAIIGRNVEILQANTMVSGGTPFSWSAAIAGALVATAVSFIIISLGTGIGFPMASPYATGPSATTLTVIGAVWLVMAQAMGFATGGYIAARMRSPAHDGVRGETTFRDAAEGLLVWAIGVVVGVIILAATASGLANIAATLGAGAATGAGMAARNADPTAYYVDTLFRTAPTSTTAAQGPGPAAPAGPAPSGPSAGPGANNPQGETAPNQMAAAPNQPATGPAAGPNTGPASGPAGQAAATPQTNQQSEQSRAEVTRLLSTGLRNGELSQEDRAYLGRVVGARTGLSPEEANRRVDQVIKSAKDVADKAAKAGSFLSFWTFMSLLIGAAAATLGGIVGGGLRDDGNLARG